MKKITPLLIGTLITLTGCYEDKGNYDLIEVNEVTISGLNSPSNPYNRYAYLGENVHIEPELTCTDPTSTKDDFDYEWLVEAKPVSHEPVLDYVPTGKTGYFNLTLLVTNRKTGRIDMGSTSLYVRSPYKVGFMLLAEKADGSTDLHYLRWDISDFFYETPMKFNVLSAANKNADMGKSPYKLIENMVNVNYGGDELLILQNEGQNSYSVSGGSLERCVNFEEEFYGGYPAGLTPKDAVFGSMLDLAVFNDGKLYTRLNGDGTALKGFHLFHYLNIPTYIESKDATTHIDRFIPSWWYNNNNILLAYDNGNNRFLAIGVGATSTDPGNAKVLTIQDNSSNPNKFANLNNLGAYKLMYCKNTQSNTFKCILKKGSEYFFQSFNLAKGWWSTNASVSNPTMVKFSGNVDDNSLYDVTPNNRYLYFTSGKTLYYCEFIGDNQIIRSIHTFNKPINHMKLDFNGGHMLLTTEGGKIYFFDCSDQNLGAANPWEAGLVYESPDGEDIGEIRDVIFKYGDLNNFGGASRGGNSNPF